MRVKRLHFLTWLDVSKYAALSLGSHERRILGGGINVE
jgi:hypothetical protein